MSKQAQCCKTCKLWNIDEARSQSGRVMSDRVARCNWVSNEVYPDSVLSHPPKARYMTAQMGEHCPCWQEAQR